MYESMKSWHTPYDQNPLLEDAKVFCRFSNFLQGLFNCYSENEED